VAHGLGHMDNTEQDRSFARRVVSVLGKLSQILANTWDETAVPQPQNHASESTTCWRMPQEGLFVSPFKLKGIHPAEDQCQ